MNPYDELGVPQDADRDQIKRAHRKAIREHHPDAGGDPDKFLAAQRSYEVLMDPDARDRFDETGATEDADLMAKNMLVMERLGAILAGLVQSEHDLVRSDMSMIIRNGLTTIRLKIEKDISDNKKLVARAETLQARFKRKKGKAKAGAPPPGILDQAMDQGLRSLQRNDRKMREELELHTKVELVFAAFKYSFEPPPPPPTYDPRDTEGMRHYFQAKGISPNSSRWP
jgi:curved DNA-binding protein CbpA